MRFADIKRRMVVHTLEHGKIFVLEAKRGELRGTRMERPHYGQVVTIVGTSDEELHVTSYGGAVLYAGITGAEIEAQQVALRLAKAGVDVEYKVKDDDFVYASRMATVIAQDDLLGDSVHGTWMTKLDGRRRTTTFLSGLHFRGYMGGRRRKGHVKLSKTRFFDQVSSLCWRHEDKRNQRLLANMKAA